MKLAIIGGGISGLAAAWQAHQDGLKFDIFEAKDRFGGVIETQYTEDDQVVLECGAESCLRSKPELLDLCHELGLEDEIISTTPENSGAFVVRDGQLHPIPQGFRLMAPSAWWPFLRSDLISWTGKLRAGLDLVLPVKERGDGPEESLSQFVTRRLGAEILDYLAQPLVAGIYGADPQSLSLEATMPLFQRLEQEHGSVIKGLRALGTETRAQGARYNLFFGLKRGFGSVIQALCEQLPKESLHTGAAVDKVEKIDSGWQVTVRGQKPQKYDAVIIALPAPRAATLIESFAGDVAASLKEILYRGAVTVNIAYDRAEYLHWIPRAYGFVVPAGERRPILACTFSSRKWLHRGSEKQGIVRTYFGGPTMEWANTASDEDLLALSRSQLEELLGIDAEPLEYRVHRWPVGLPEYKVGHRQKVQQIRQSLESHSGIALVGNYLDGVGMPDCVQLGRKAVGQVSAALV